MRGEKVRSVEWSGGEERGIKREESKWVRERGRKRKSERQQEKE